MEWVYNPADMDAAPVLFARDMGEEADQALFRYFHDRRIWRLTVDRDIGPFEMRLAGLPIGTPASVHHEVRGAP